MDYKLENEFGDEIIEKACELLHSMKDKVKYKLKFVVLSSTEDTQVKTKLLNLGILKI